MNSMKGIPAIRFNCFEGEWTLSKLDDVADFYDELRKPITESARESGPYPYYGASGIIDYVKDYIFDEEMILLSEDGANILDRNYRVCFLASGKYWVNNHAHVVKAKRGNNNFFICETLERLRYDKYNTGTAQPKINQDVCKKLPLYTTSNDEQTAIGNYFQKLDSLIKQHQKKHDKLSNLKKAMLEKMFPKQGEAIPEIRFKEFSREWEEELLGDKMTVTSVKRIHQSDWTSSGVRFLRARDIVSSYKNEEPTDYLYIAKEKYEQYSQLSGRVEVGDLLVTGVGTIGVPMLVTDDAPLYFKDGNIIWFKNENKVDGLFLFYSFVGKPIQTYIKHEAGTGTVGTYTINSGKNTPISLPTREEQTAIGNYFQKLDTLINQHQQQITKLTNIKQACLSKMFV
ncbi:MULTISPECIES: restriction endonuclease subunit S [Vibrio]|uniref:restriction endonuclease subunit S n=1 Tax=Vibrio TaxID=662 RepID=UPI0002DF4883|nr:MULTISPECIES: restriction endonuclease subunit S [Vibrio]OCH68991.1 type I restriction endonuclease subunit S [Vibrio splendidus]OMO36529.1 type I restriction endonuclease subunit S [Vibrio sp. 10N.261.45.E1]PMJ28289.1 type I restriction endonuclease subunit S [Vibrio sp. 10N.286.45.B6]PMM91077.1 type I restriction endonuclease subunit S [Vibrio sp. 10N.261.46.E8]